MRLAPLRQNRLVNLARALVRAPILRAKALARLLLPCWFVFARPLSITLLLAATSFVPIAIAQPNTTRAGELDRSEQSSQQALRRVVEQRIAAARLADSVSAYTVSPAIIQLRRYVEPGGRVKLVCVIELSLTDRQGALFATLRGSASIRGTNTNEAVNAAAEAAVSRIPELLRRIRATPDLAR